MDDKKNIKSMERLKVKSEPVLKKHVGLIHCENKLTFLQRKICNIFLFNALDGIDKQDIHSIPLKQLCSLIGYRSNDIDLIKKAIKGLISTIMEWNLLDDSKFIHEENFSPETISWNASSLLAGASIERGVINYSYSPQIKTILSSLEIYGRINLFVQSKFKSSYSLILYENCVRFKNIGRTSWFKLDLFRALMGLTNGQYELFKELKRSVITVAVNEVNKKSDIQIEPEYQKTGRSVTAIKFHICENSNYQPSFKRTIKSTVTENESHGSDSTMLDILISEFNIKKDQAMKIINTHKTEYITEKMGIVRTSKNVDTPGAYLISALNNDYKKNIKSSLPVSTVQTTYLRETDEASEIRSLKKKYLSYKFQAYVSFLENKSILENTKKEFISLVFTNNPVMGALYKRKGLDSQFAMKEFIDYVDNKFESERIKIMSFDEYITEEEAV